MEPDLAQKVPSQATFKPMCPPWGERWFQEPASPHTPAPLLPGLQEPRGCQDASALSPGLSLPDTSAQPRSPCMYSLRAIVHSGEPVQPARGGGESLS